MDDVQGVQVGYGTFFFFFLAAKGMNCPKTDAKCEDNNSHKEVAFLIA